MNAAAIPEDALRRFARLAAPLLQGSAARSYGPRAARNRPGRGLEFLDTRVYEPGDDVRTIDWRQSARGRHLVVRRYRDETAADWFLCVDCSGSMHWGGAKWPLAVQLAMALSYTLLYAGHRVAVLLFSDRVRAMANLGRGPQQFARVMRTLLQEEAVVGGTSAVGGAPAVGRASALGRASAVGGASGPDQDRGWKPLPRMPLPQPGHSVGAASRRDSTSNLGACCPLVAQNGNVFVIGDFLVPGGMRPDLRALRARAATVNAIQVLGADELAVPAAGATALRDVESGESRHINLSAAAIEAARDSLRAHCDRLQRSCADLGIRFTSSPADRDWQGVLLEHLRH